MRVLAGAAVVMAIAAADVAAAAPEDPPGVAAPTDPVEAPDAPADEDGGISAAALGASLFPGVLIHGSGHYVAEKPGTARTLLWAELSGLGLIVLALVPAVIVGANPYVVPFSAVAAMGGVALFGGSWLFDVYGSAVPEHARGRPQLRPSRMVSFLGYRYVYDPLFEYRHFVAQGFELWVDQFKLAPRLDLSPDDQNARYRGLLSYRLWGNTPDTIGTGVSDGSFVDVEGGLTHHRFPRDGFDVSTAELALHSRWDMRRVERELTGTFVELGTGLGISRYDYRTQGAGSDNNGLLLMSFALGAYLGDPARRGGEARLYYDHRHDDYAAGLKLIRSGSGVIGHFGADLRYYLSQDWGAHVDFQVGSAYITSVSLLYRPERAR